VNNVDNASAFKLDASHDLLREVVEKVCAEFAGGAVGFGDGDWRRQIWQTLAELDVLGATLPSAAHGGGGGPIELMVIMQAIGKHLATVPYVSTIVCAGQLLAGVGSAAQVDDLLSRIIAGQHTVAFCALEEGDHGQVTRVATKAVPRGGGYDITGRKSAVLAADQCDSLLVVAELADAPGRYGAFFVDPDAAGVVSEHRRTIDGLTAAEISLTNVFVDVDSSLAPAEGISEQLEAVYDLAVVGLCAEACGSIEAVFESTVEYVKTREQFGQPLGRFQVVRHRIVDMAGRLELATAITHWAAASFDLSASTRRRAVAAAKAYVGRAARNVAQNAVQLHGAIGTTDELALTRHLRRIEVFNTQFGTPQDHVRRYLDVFETTPLGFQADEPVTIGCGVHATVDATVNQRGYGLI
jgi:alkylation response protein AidB-like acyl-CoA dehydrogenase